MYLHWYIYINGFIVEIKSVQEAFNCGHWVTELAYYIVYKKNYVKYVEGKSVQ